MCREVERHERAELGSRVCDPYDLPHAGEPSAIHSDEVGQDLDSILMVEANRGDRALNISTSFLYVD